MLNHAVSTSPFWLTALEEYVPILAAAVVTIVLARTGFQSKMAEYRRDTLDLIRLRAETLEKELADAHVEIQDLTRDIRTRERRIESLEDEVESVRHGIPTPRRPPMRRGPRESTPLPPHAPDVDDAHD